MPATDERITHEDDAARAEAVARAKARHPSSPRLEPSAALPSAAAPAPRETVPAGSR